MVRLERAHHKLLDRHTVHDSCPQCEQVLMHGEMTNGTVLGVRVCRTENACVENKVV